MFALQIHFHGGETQKKQNKKKLVFFLNKRANSTQNKTKLVQLHVKQHDNEGKRGERESDTNRTKIPKILVRSVFLKEGGNKKNTLTTRDIGFGQ